jgi:hypothetical protein
MMKLSELQQICKNLAKLATPDAEVEFRIDDVNLTLETAQIEGMTEVNMERGCLKPVPTWDNRVVLFFSEPGIPL